MDTLDGKILLLLSAFYQTRIAELEEENKKNKALIALNRPLSSR